MGEGLDDTGGAGASLGVTYGKYRVVRQIGEGAFGRVYEAVLPGPMGFTKKVALKKIRSHLVKKDPRFIKSLVNEARIGGLLHHPNVVGILEFGEIEGSYFLAMDYIEGATLTDILALCRQRKLLLPRFVVVDLASQICKGLQYAHRLRDPERGPLHLVHRDLKPSNIIVDEQGVARILDFGIAKAASNLFNTTHTGMIKGTPRYMSPEQIAGEPNLTARSDIFSMGVVLYEMITGRVLFSAHSMASLVHNILLQVPEYQLDAAEVCFPGCKPVLERCLQKDPADRYGSATELLAAIQEMGRPYPPEADMADVVGRLLPEIEQAEDEDFEDTDAFLAATQGKDYEPGSDGRPDRQFTPIAPPEPTSAGWDRFAEEFTGMGDDVDTLTGERVTRALPSRGVVGAEELPSGPQRGVSSSGESSSAGAGSGGAPAPRNTPALTYVAIGLSIGLAALVVVLLVLYVFPPGGGDAGTEVPTEEPIVEVEPVEPSEADPALFDIVHIFVHSTPDGASVAYLSERGEMALGTTPLSIDLAVEKDREGDELGFVLRKAGYEDERVSDDVEKGRVEMVVAMRRARSTRPTSGVSPSTPTPAPVEEVATPEPATPAAEEPAPAGGEEDGFKANPYD